MLIESDSIRKLFSIFLIFFGLTFCRKLQFEHPCDPNTNSFLEYSLFVNFLGTSDKTCYQSPRNLNLNSSIPRPNLWGAFAIDISSGNIRDVEIYGDKAFIGGMFDYIGPNTGSLAILDGNSLKLLPESSCPYFEIDGIINKIIDDGNGNAIVGGNFNSIKGIKMKAIAKIKSDCSVDLSFNANLVSESAEIRTMLIQNGRLFIGGYFTGTFNSSSSQTREHLAAIDPTTGNLITDWNPSLTGSEVNAIESDGSDLFIGGNFSQFGVTPIANLAKVDLLNGTNAFPLGDPDATVNTITFVGANLAVGGNFTTIDGNTSQYIALLSKTGTGVWFNTLLDSSVSTLYFANNKLYVGGNFTVPRYTFISLDPSTGNDLNENFQILDGNINTIRKYKENLLLIGSYKSILGKTFPYFSILNPNDNSVSSLDLRVSNMPQERGDLFQFSNGNLLVGASFYSLQGVVRKYLAEIDLTTGQPTSWNPEFTFPGGVEVIQALSIFDNQLYIGGSFTKVNNVNRNRMASFYLYNQPTLSDFKPSIAGYTQTIKKINFKNGYLFVSGGFSTVNDISSPHFAKLNPYTGEANFDFYSNTNFGINNMLTISDGRFLIYGEFNQINGGTSVNRFAIVNSETGNLIQSPSGPNIGIINHILELGNKLLIGFDDIASPLGTGCCLGIYDISTLSPIAHSFNMLPLAGGRIREIKKYGEELFMIGNFSGLKGSNRASFASINANTFELNSFDPEFNAEINNIKETDADFYFVGRFSKIQNRRRNYWVRMSKSDKSITK